MNLNTETSPFGCSITSQTFNSHEKKSPKIPHVFPLIQTTQRYGKKKKKVGKERGQGRSLCAIYCSGISQEHLTYFYEGSSLRLNRGFAYT